MVFITKPKELYEQKKQESDYYRQVVTRMASYMGYEPGDVFPTVITRGLMQFKHYGYAAVLATMEECQPKIEYALASRSFGSDYQKASYLMAILTNNINDVARRLKSQQEFESRQAVPQPAPPRRISLPLLSQKISQIFWKAVTKYRTPNLS